MVCATYVTQNCRALQTSFLSALPTYLPGVFSAQGPLKQVPLACRCVVCTQGECLPGLGHVPSNAEGLPSLGTEATAQ